MIYFVMIFVFSPCFSQCLSLLVKYSAVLGTSDLLLVLTKMKGNMLSSLSVYNFKHAMELDYVSQMR